MTLKLSDNRGRASSRCHICSLKDEFYKHMNVTLSMWARRKVTKTMLGTSAMKYQTNPQKHSPDKTTKRHARALAVSVYFPLIFHVHLFTCELKTKSHL